MIAKSSVEDLDKWVASNRVEYYYGYKEGGVKDVILIKKF